MQHGWSRSKNAAELAITISPLADGDATMGRLSHNRYFSTGPWGVSVGVDNAAPNATHLAHGECNLGHKNGKLSSNTTSRQSAPRPPVLKDTAPRTRARGKKNGEALSVHKGRVAQWS